MTPRIGFGLTRRCASVRYDTSVVRNQTRSRFSRFACPPMSPRGLTLRADAYKKQKNEPCKIIAQRRRGCSLSRVRVNWVIIHLRPDGRTGIVTL